MPLVHWKRGFRVATSERFLQPPCPEVDWCGFNGCSLFGALHSPIDPVVSPADTRIEAELAVAHGAVYRVRDEPRARCSRSKPLPDTGKRLRSVPQGIFTLSCCSGTRGSEVYDYGVSEARPFYTMELLDGDDLRALAPISFRQACRYLRDVASSLALLHAHRLLHRDLTPRNVRATSDGHCKLLDFGALAPFGTPQVLVGTAPFVPPEAMRGLVLDQRADLFSFGALAYYLLTRTHAYPAKTLEQLEAFWREPPLPPSVRLAELEAPPALEPIPPALDFLVASLLSLDPLVRPASPAEVIERLDAIAGLEPEPGPWMAQSYLASAQLVGRTSELERARELLSRSSEGSGRVITIRHARGAGGTRLLTEIGSKRVSRESQFAGRRRGSSRALRGGEGAFGAALPSISRPDHESCVPDLRALGFSEAPGPSGTRCARLQSASR